MSDHIADLYHSGPWSHAQGLAWYVLRTKHHKERATQKRVEHTGLTSYLPLLLQWPRPVVGSDVVPMFPCYLFVRASMPDDFYRVRFTPGVNGFVTRTGGPAALDAAVISFLRSRESPDGIIRCDPLPPGRGVRIVAGPFKGLVAIVESRFPARERVRVLLDILQRQTRVDLPERWIRRA
jgi:transcription antitermination factor NusG